MKIKILSLLFLCLLSNIGFCQKAGIEKANDLYNKAKYQDAIKEYELILNSGKEAATLYFNLANAYYKSGNLSRAILNYERAKLLSPSDQDIDYNLNLANSQTLDKLEQVPEFIAYTWVNKISRSKNSDFWSYLSITVFILALISMSFYMFASSVAKRKLGFVVAILLIVSSIIFYVFASKSADSILNRDKAIIINSSVTVKGQPDNSGTDLFLLHEGTKVKLIDSLDNWRRIQMSDGNDGWVLDTDIEII
ncbi:MAG: tetratricopeptide repeat protein [Marinifilaceae bacterium]|jgi:tetratricopeptide (TPR) repeat protein|nr:tetratricopeptide repeat protein [Marinifilaceae bacterium]